jgi:nucleoid-associated protein YgaU
MGNGAKIGLVGVLALIVLVVAVWDKTNDDGRKDELAGLRFVQSPKPAEPNPRVKPLREPAAEDHVSGQMDQHGALAAPAAAPPPPAPAPAARTPDAAPAPKKYRIQPHDTLSSIAAENLGNRAKWRAIYEANKGVIANPDRLPVGKEILIPAAQAPGGGAEPHAAAPAAGPEPRAAAPVAASVRKTHVVKHGETLSIVAEQELGSRAKWRVIYEANRDKLSDPDAVREGQELTIP